MAKIHTLKKVPSVTNTVLGHFKEKSDQMLRDMRETGVTGFAMVAYKLGPDGNAQILYDGWFHNPLDQYTLPMLLAEEIKDHRKG